MLYELITISCPLLGLGRASEGVRAWTAAPEARGELLGCWRTDIGSLGRIMALRGYATLDDLMAERDRAVLLPSPVGAPPEADAVSLESYRPFPFLPPVRPGRRGNVFATSSTSSASSASARPRAARACTSSPRCRPTASTGRPPRPSRGTFAG